MRRRIRHSRALGLAFSAAALPVLVAAAWKSAEEKPWPLAPPAPVVATTPPKLEKLDGQTCGECHADVVAEWADTAHAVAWVDEVYQDEIVDKTRPQACHGCHIPKPILADGLAAKAEARADRLHLGVSCEACHLGPGGAMLGPWGAPTSAHPTAASDHMTEKASSAMCALCHATNIGPVIGIAKDFAATKVEESGRTCVGCHMAPLERAPSKGAADGAVARRGRSHALQTPRDPAFLARAFEATLRVDGARAVVTLANRAGHRVPGLIGRKIEFVAEALGPDGAVLATASRSFDTRSFLPAEESAEIVVAAGASSVRLRGSHEDPRAEKAVEFLDVRLSPTPASAPSSR